MEEARAGQGRPAGLTSGALPCPLPQAWFHVKGALLVGGELGSRAFCRL